MTLFYYLKWNPAKFSRPSKIPQGLISTKVLLFRGPSSNPHPAAPVHLLANDHRVIPLLILLYSCKTSFFLSFFWYRSSSRNTPSLFPDKKTLDCLCLGIVPALLFHSQEVHCSAKYQICLFFFLKGHFGDLDLLNVQHKQ